MRNHDKVVISPTVYATYLEPILLAELTLVLDLLNIANLSGHEDGHARGSMMTLYMAGFDITEFNIAGYNMEGLT